MQTKSIYFFVGYLVLEQNKLSLTWRFHGFFFLCFSSAWNLRSSLTKRWSIPRKSSRPLEPTTEVLPVSFQISQVSHSLLWSLTASKALKQLFHCFVICHYSSPRLVFHFPLIATAQSLVHRGDPNEACWMYSRNSNMQSSHIFTCSMLFVTQGLLLDITWFIELQWVLRKSTD